MLEDFKKYLEINGKSANTINSYLIHIRGYLKWFDESKGVPFTKLHRENVTDYLSYLKTIKKDGPKTINAKVSALIQLNEFLVNENIQDTIVLSKKDNQRVQQEYASLAKINEKDVEKFRQIILDHEGSRNHAIITMMAYGGLRISETLGITMKDFNLTSRELLVLGKGNKYRTVFIGDKVYNALKEWLKDREGLINESEYLFVSNRGNSLNRTVINKLFNKYSAMIGVEITPHDLRHYFCSLALKKGLSIHEVANQAGHSNIHTTLLYSNPSKRELLDKMKGL